MDNSTYWILVIDTNKYAGNFERELCAYTTGHIGDCGVGDDMAKIFDEEEAKTKKVFYPESEHWSCIMSLPDENGCARPCSIWDNPSWFNHGMGGHFRKDEPGVEEKALKHYIESVKEYYEPHLKQALDRKGLPLEERGHPSWTDEALDREIERNKKKISDAESMTKVRKYSASTSVAIFFDTQPTEDMIELIKRRTYKYAKEQWGSRYTQKGDLEIENIRLLKREVKLEEINL